MKFFFFRNAKLMYKVFRKAIPTYLSNNFHQRDADGIPNSRSIRRKKLHYAKFIKKKCLKIL